MKETNFGEAALMQAYQYSPARGAMGMGAMPFFSMRKLRLVYNELAESSNFEFTNFEDFKHQVLSSVVPQLELNKWQAIASRR
ncbi:hypothetical protein KJ365_02420 [Glaciecola sp. XM2]|jgi:hypothetical protein|uniref:hypothetical protein n=1 Tax=Glaciecola sp. XM2 TaxID=1914931 RepID=UPI001BDEFC19|nr:hypothetical protein [Glaciecola sp. XM2]MBT1449719.1 hypothetical protein [Glaciecola sp. XM2]